MSPLVQMQQLDSGGILWQQSSLPLGEQGLSPMQGSPIQSNRDRNGSPVVALGGDNQWGFSPPGRFGLHHPRKGEILLFQYQPRKIAPVCDCWGRHAAVLGAGGGFCLVY